MNSTFGRQLCLRVEKPSMLTPWTEPRKEATWFLFKSFQNWISLMIFIENSFLDIFKTFPDIIIAWIPFQCVLWDSHQGQNTSTISGFISADMQITRFETHFEVEIVTNNLALYFQADFVWLKTFCFQFDVSLSIGMGFYGWSLSPGHCKDFAMSSPKS